jgi:hypothetical protein
MSGKNSADIRMVVDALDLCYTKSHLDTFVIISGDSDFSPLVSKLRENNKTVIGVGVKNSSSDLLISNCDEFIFYDDLVRETQVRVIVPKKSKPIRKRAASKGEAHTPNAAAGAAPEAAETESANSAAKPEQGKKEEAISYVIETIEALLAERGAEEKIWGSMVKQTLKRRKPSFNERYYGFKAFGDLLEEAKARKLLDIERDEKSGAYIIKGVMHE